MSNLPTAEEFIKNFHRQEGHTFEQTVPVAMIEFAKLHCEAQAKEIVDKAYVTNNHQQGGVWDSDDFEVDEESILNAYPLTNIK